jgi:uncharacterized Zn-binding protein involved in type VI secretion
MLTPGPGSMNVLIGFLPAWRGIPAAMAAELQTQQSAGAATIAAAEAATAAAAGTPGLPAAEAAEQATKASVAAEVGAAMSAAAAATGADIHMCDTPLPIPPHGPGVVINASPTVMINNLPAARQGDQVLEAVGPPDPIAMGCPTVIIGPE